MMKGALSRYLLTVLVVGVILGASPWIGPELTAEQGEFVFWQLRVPRVLMACLVGATLASSGAAYQTLFSNALATPSTVGTTAGAALGALVAVLWGSGSLLSMSLVTVFAFLGALSVTMFIAAIASSGRASVNDVLLAGVAITLAAGSLSMGLQFHADMASTFEAVRWSLGNLAQVGYRGVVMLAPFAVISVGVILSQSRALDSLVLGEEKAASQGVDVVRVRTVVLGVGALGVGAAVAWCGPISFVGLIVPHLVRMWFGASRRVLVPLSALCGAGFLVLCDTFARTVLTGRDLPVGVMTAAIGAPLLLWLILRMRTVRA